MNDVPWKELLNYGESIAVMGGLLIWLIRIEPRMTLLESEHKDIKTEFKVLEDRHHALDVEIRKYLSDIRVSQAKVEGWISGREAKDR